MDPDFATVLLEIKRKSNGSGLLFPNPATGLSYHASPIQQDYIRRAGWCLVRVLVAVQFEMRQRFGSTFATRREKIIVSIN
jgi:hypothetical protein